MLRLKHSRKLHTRSLIWRMSPDGALMRVTDSVIARIRTVLSDCIEYFTSTVISSAVLAYLVRVRLGIVHLNTCTLLPFPCGPDSCAYV